MARVLVIEDDKEFLKLLGLHLRGAGHTVRAAADAADGIRALLAEAPDVILSDIAMPYLDGLDLLQAVRSDSTTRDIPFILLTGRADTDTYMRARELGADDCLTKPIHLEELIASIDRALKKVRATPAPAAVSVPSLS